MNPYKLKNVFEYLTSNNQLLKKKLKLGTSEIPIPPKRQDVIDVEVINRFTKANPRVDTTNLKPLSVKQSDVKKPDEAMVQGVVSQPIRTVDPERDSFKKISNVIGAYNRYRRGKKNPRLNFNQFFELYSTENFAEGGRAGYEDGGMLVQPSDDGSRPGYKDDEYVSGYNLKERIINEKKYKKALTEMLEEINGLTKKGYGNITNIVEKYSNKLGPSKDKVKKFYDNEGNFKSFNFNREQRKIRGAVIAEAKELNLIDMPENMIKAVEDYKKLGKEIPRGMPQKIIKANKVPESQFYKTLNKVNAFIKQKKKFTNLDASKKFQQDQRAAALKKYSSDSFERMTRGSKTIQGGHTGDIYNEFVTTSTKAYTPTKINMETLTDVDATLKKIGLKRDAAIKAKDFAEVERLNTKGINLSAATEGYKTFKVVQPDGSNYIYGIKQSITTDPMDLTGNINVQELTSGKDKEFELAKKRFKAKQITAEEFEIARSKAEKKLFDEGTSKELIKFQKDTAIKNAKIPKKEIDRIDKQVKNLIASLGGGTCSVFSGKKATLKADGGRIGLATGTPNLDDCYKSGSAAINSGKVPVDKADDFTKLLKRMGTIGRGIMKFGIIPEAMYVAADSLIRLGMGDTFKEAGLRASDYLLPGDQTKAAEMSKVSRFFGDETGELVGRAIDYKNQLAKIQSLEGQVSNLDNLSDVGEFDYIGDLSGESNTKKNLLSQAKKDLDNKFKISEAEQLYAESKQDDAYDASKATSFLSNLKRKYGDSSNNLSDIETLAAPEKTQMQLNLNMLPAVPKDFMMATDDELKNYVLEESVRIGKKLDPQVYIDEKEKLKKDFMTKGPGVYGKEQVYGTQGIFAEPLLKSIARKENSINDLEREAVGQRNKFNIFDRDNSVLGTGLRGFSAASGGIASLTKTIPPESGPTPQGLPYVYNNVKKI